MRYVCLDIKATGNSRRDRPWEIAAVAFDTKFQATDSLFLQINPEIELSPQAEHDFGVTNEKSAARPALSGDRRPVDRVSQSFRNLLFHSISLANDTGQCPCKLREKSLVRLRCICTKCLTAYPAETGK